MRKVEGLSEGRGGCGEKEHTCVLRGESCNNCCSVHGAGAERFQVRLNTCAAAGVRTSDGQDAWHFFGHRSSPPSLTALIREPSQHDAEAGANLSSRERCAN